MARQSTITERVKYLIKYIIGQGFAQNQEDLGRQMGISNKSYLSQLVNNRIPNDTFIDSLLNFVPNFNKEWLYNEEIQDLFIEEKTTDIGSACADVIKPDQKIKDLENAIELLKKDVRYYADIADTRLGTIETQNKVINALEKLLNLYEEEPKK